MKSEEIRSRFLAFFEKRGHTIIPSASLVPENDPSVLFTTAGMHPLVPYLLGEPHPSGSRRLANSQKCVRTTDIDEIGDNTHATFFEMLGNWSLGDYFKEDAIKWSYEFLTSKEEGLGLNPDRLYVTVFEGDENAPRDEEAFDIWKKYVPENRIYFMGAESNWWSPGDNGPCGPDSEMFYDVTENGLGDMTKEEYLAADERQDVVEIWNDVFMEYEKKDGRVIGKLKQQNVDTGSGLERVATVVQGKNNIFDTDLLKPIIDKISEHTKSDDIRAKRIIADHIRTSVFMIADGVTPSHTDRGSVLRRLITNLVRHLDGKTLTFEQVSQLVNIVISIYVKQYPSLVGLENKIVDKLTSEILGLEEKMDDRETKLKKLLEYIQNKHNIRREVVGAKEIKKGKPSTLISKQDLLHSGEFTAKNAFDLYTQEGVDIKMALKYIEKYYKNLPVENDIESKFNKLIHQHQEISRQGSEQKFKGGLADHSEQSVKYHTATHLLHKALREVLGNHVFQKGSNITPERLRFDFSHSEKMTDEQKKRVEDMVNEKINESLPVSYEDIPLAEAEKKGAIGLFEEKYGDTVRVYKIGDFSLEFCGGPHVKNTSELGHFKIAKEEACSAGVRRIKAVLE